MCALADEGRASSECRESHMPLHDPSTRPPSRRPGGGPAAARWRLPIAVAGVAAVAIVGGVGVQVATASESASVRAAAPAPLASFPPKSNGAWIYDGAARGQWLPVIQSYNQIATGEHKITQINTYGSDIEGDSSGYDTYYDTSAKTGNRDTTSEYYNALVLAPALAGTASTSYTFSPIIDAQLTSDYISGFNGATKAVAEASADKVAAQVCADERADGIQFDIESFDVTKDGQYYFYNQISKDFAGLHSGSTATDPYGCVDAKHANGRYYSVFAFAASVDPANGSSAARVKDVFETNGKANGYFVDSLYDLGTGATGHLNDLPTYQSLVTTEVTHMKTWANSLGISYAFGIPASASAHEFTSCTGGCVAGADGSLGNPMIEYTKRAVGAINSAGAPQDPLFIGTNIWSMGSFTAISPFNFYPSPPPTDVLTWLAANLPGSKAAGTGTTTPTPTPTPTATPTPTPTPTAPAGTQLITNGGFENNLTGWNCDGTYSVDSVAASGTHGVRLTPSATVTSVCSQTVSVVSGKQYTLSAKLKSNGAYISVGVKNGAEVTSNASTFTSTSLPVTATASTITVYVQAYKQQTGDTWADDVSLIAAG